MTTDYPSPRQSNSRYFGRSQLSGSNSSPPATFRSSQPYSCSFKGRKRRFSGSSGSDNTSDTMSDLRSSNGHILGSFRKVFGQFFLHVGELIADHPYPFIIVPVLIALALSTGIFYIRVQDDLRFLYSPTYAQARREYAIHQSFTGEDKQSTYCALAVESRGEGKNLLTKRKTELIQEINTYVLNNLTFALGGKEYHFGRDICPKISFCPDSNRILQKFIDVYWNEKLRESPRVHIEYPVMKIFDSSFFLPAHLFGVTTNNETGRIEEIEMVHMTYPIPGTEQDSAEEVAVAFERSLLDYLHSDPLVPLQTSIFSLRILKEELSKNTFYTLPFIGLTVCMIVLFTCVSCSTTDMVTSKPMEGLLGVASSSLAIVSSAGLMMLCGVPFISQVTVMPFLALAIGVDDTYVMIGAWQRTNRRLSPKKRLGLAMKEAGSAITVTSITDCLSFGIGAFCPTPAISIFCKFTAAAIFFDFFYQVTFFPAIMALGGRREAKGKHCIKIWQDADPLVVEKSLKKDYTCPVQKFFGTYYAQQICRPWIRILVFILYFVYMCLAIYGCTTLEPNLSPSNLLVDDSPLRHYIELAETHMWRENMVARVYVNKAPDFSKGPKVVREFINFVMDLEKLQYSMGKNSTQLWLRDFLRYQQYFDSPPENFYRDFKGYLGISLNKQWGNYVNWIPRNRGQQKSSFVNKFYFTSGFQIKDWRDRTKMLLKWRETCAKYPQYDAVIYDENNFYSDQILSLPQTSMQTMGIAFICMTVVCAVFISNQPVVFWVVFTMLTMGIGIAGFLALGGAQLSPTTVMNVLMSVGLSVDFVTHVGYRIYRTRLTDPDERIADALQSIAWPVVQGGVSTVMAVFSLQFVRSYVVRVFFHTICLVVALGLFHGLIVLPVILRTFAPAKPHAERRLTKADAQGRSTEKKTEKSANYVIYPS